MLLVIIDCFNFGATAFFIIIYLTFLSLTSLQGPPNVQSPAAWSAMARLSVWNQSSLSPTELKRDTQTLLELIPLKSLRCNVWAFCTTAGVKESNAKRDSQLCQWVNAHRSLNSVTWQSTSLRRGIMALLKCSHYSGAKGNAMHKWHYFSLVTCRKKCQNEKQNHYCFISFHLCGFAFKELNMRSFQSWKQATLKCGLLL